MKQTKEHTASQSDAKTKRPPIIAVMGHVDHGKTTLLDYIRKTSVATREAGGITQSIGAYEITHGGQKITFIDTPGHEAFGAMRSYGAALADLAILVVAADDSVKPQTKDALQCILDAKIPYVVAINKTDKPNANIERVKQDLAQNEVFLEGYGGAISWNAISAKTGAGVHELLDHLLLVAEVEGFSCELGARAEGVVLSCRSNERRGLMVGVVLQNGTLKVGQTIKTPHASGKIKILENFLGEQVQTLTPSAPAVVLGFEILPHVGETFWAADNLTDAPPAQKKSSKKVIAEKDMGGEALPVILKSDEAASLEVLEGVLGALSKTMPLSIVQSSIGNIHENDVKTAESMHALIIGFRVKSDRAATNLALSKKVTVITSDIMYELEKELQELGKKSNAETARAIEILAIFGTPKGKEQVVGGRVANGSVKNQESFEIMSDNKIIGKGRIINLQSGRKDVPEAPVGQEVGLLVDSETAIKVGQRFIFS